MTTEQANLQDKLDLFMQLDQCNGTERYYSLKPLSHIVLTDGTKFLNDRTPLVQDAAISITHIAHLRKEWFLTITITVHGTDAKVVFDDGNNNVLHSQEYQSCDLPEGQYKMYCTNKVLMLASEY